MRRGLLAVAVLASACSLPLPHGVKTVGEVRADVQQPAQLKVFPPGPKKNETPLDVVNGFLNAQASSDNRHAIAREFLSDDERQRWDDSSTVKVYRLDTLTVRAVPGSDDVQVRATLAGEVSQDGSYQPTSRVLSEPYHLVRDVAGDWRLASVPAGLRLTAENLQSAYSPQDIYYLARTTGSGDPPHLVPDRVFLPIGTDLATTLVRRLLQEPSQALRGAVSGVLPTGGLSLRKLTHGPAGLITVDLDGLIGGLLPEQLHDLSARIVWTLRADPTFQALRLLDLGKQIKVPDTSDVQDASDWQSYDPQGLGVDPPYFYTRAQRLLSSLALPATALTSPAGDTTLPVDELAVSTDRATIGVLEHGPQGVVTVLAGGLRDTPSQIASGQDLASPSWGSNAYGLWMIQSQHDIVIADPDHGGLTTVPFRGQPAGALTHLAVSRDGARVVLVIGGRLWMTHVDPSHGIPQLVGMTPLLPELTKVSGVAWATSTSFVVLGSLAGQAQLLRVPIDGSAFTVVPTGLVQPTSVAASETQLLIGAGGTIYSAGHGQPARVATGEDPVFPG